MKLDIQVLGDKHHWLYHPTYSEAVENEDVGLDIPTLQDVTVPARAQGYKVKLKIKTAANHGYMLVPRSSIVKTPLRLSNSIGIIDKSYRGELMAVVDNISDEDFNINYGQCLFQIVAFDGNLPKFNLVDTLDETKRGDGGFGSTTNP